MSNSSVHRRWVFFFSHAPCVRAAGCTRPCAPSPPPNPNPSFPADPRGLSLGSDPGIRSDAVQTFSWCLSATEQMRPRSCEKRSRPLRSILPPHCLARGHTGSLCGCRTRAALHWQMSGWRKSAHADTCARRRAKSDKKTGLGGRGGVILVNGAGSLCPSKMWQRGV